MNIDTYLQLTQMPQNGNQGGGPSGPMPPQAPQAPQQNVPHGTFDPLKKGSGDAIEAVRHSLSAPNNHKMRPWVNLAGNVARGLYASSGTPFGRAMAQQEFNPYAAQDQKMAENMAIMKQLQKAEQARQYQEMQMSHHAEQKRHNLATEGLYGRKAMQPSKEELSEQAIADLQKEIPGAVPMSALGGAARSDAHKELRTRTNYPSKLYPIQKTLDEMVNIVDKNPDLSTSLSAALFPKEYGGGAIATAKLKAMPHEKRVAIERLNKLANDLVLKQVHGLGTQRASIFLEKMMNASNPHYGLTPESVRAIRDSHRQDYDLSVADSKVARGAISGNYYMPMVEPESLETEQETAQEPTEESKNSRREQLLQRAQQLEQQISGGQQ